MSNRNLLTALVANSEGFDEVAKELDIDESLIEKGLNDYDSLSRREQTILESAVTTYVNVTLDDLEPDRAQDIQHLADELELATTFIDNTLEDYFHTLVSNGLVEVDQLSVFANIFPNLPVPIAETMLRTIGEGKETAQKWVDAYDAEENLTDEGSEFWEIMREYYDEQ